MLKNATRALLSLVLATTFFAGSAAAPVPAAKKDCCGTTCPARAPAPKTCCRPAPAAPRAAVERVILPAVHVASSVMISVPVAVFAVEIPVRAPRPAEPWSESPSGLSPPAVLPA